MSSFDCDLRWRHPHPADLPPIYRMLVRAYRAANDEFPDDPSFFARYTEADPRHRDELWLVGESEGEPVTALRMFERDLRLPGGGRARLAGVGNVGTDPAYAHRGYATSLLERSLAFMDEEGFDFSLLYTGVPALYEHVGWKSVRLPARRLTLDAPLARRSAPGIRVIEGEGGEGEGPRELYRAGYDGFPGSLARDEAYWERWIHGFALIQYSHRLLVALRGNLPVAYLAGTVDAHPGGERELRVAEGAARPGEIDVLAGLAGVLGEGVRFMSWPEVPWLTAAFEGLGGSVEVFHRDGGMLRAVREGEEVPRLSYLLSALDRF